MKHALAIAQREIAERSFVLITAAILGVMPFLAILLPSVRSFGKTTAVVTIAGFAVGAFALGIGLVLGTTTIGRDLSERRLSFYFSRPVTASAIWFGKFAAALFLILVSLVLVFGPAYLYGREAWGKGWNIQARILLAALAGGAIVLYLIAHTIGTMVRSKSPWLLLDFALLLVTVVAAWIAVRPLVFGGAFDLIRGFGIGFGIALLLILIAAGAWHLHYGRVDRRANHRALSIFLWTSIAIVLGVIGIAVAYISNVDPEDIAEVQAIDSKGSWTVIGGPFWNRGDYSEAFLYNVESGKSLRLNCAYCDAQISRDGKHAVWFRPTEWKSLRMEMSIVDLSRPELKPRETGIIVNPRSARYVLSDDASRLAVIDGGLLSVVDVNTNRELGAVRLPTNPSTLRSVRAFFVTPNVVRLYIAVPQQSAGEHSIGIYEFDVVRRRLEKTGQFNEPGSSQYLMASADGSKLLVRVRPMTQPGTDAQHGVKFVARDGRTGAALGNPVAGRGFFATILDDGRQVIPDRQNGSVMLHVLRDGTVERTIAVPGYDHLAPAAEVAPGKLVVRASRDGKPRRWTTMVVDVATGTVLQKAEGLRTASWGWFDTEPRVLTSKADSAFIGDDGALVRWNPLTGEKKVLLGGKRR